MVGDEELPQSRLAELIDGSWPGAGTPVVQEMVQEIAPPVSQEVKFLAEQLLKLLGPTAEVGVQTGGPKEAGRVVRGGPQGRAPKV